MIYSLEELFKQNAQFPPSTEIKRRDSYRINELLMEDEPWTAMPDYKKRVNFVLGNMRTAGDSHYFYDANYWQDLVDKMQELIYGEPPEYSGSTNEQTAFLNNLVVDTKFTQKITEGLSDFVGLGDWVTKVERTDDGYDFTNVNPAIWYPIVDRTDVKKVLYHVLAWLVNVAKDKYELHVQIHEKGKYTNLAFAVDKYEPDAYYIDQVTKQRINCDLATLGKPLEESKTAFELGEHPTGLNDFAIIASANNARTRSIYGISDFDKITEGAMEYNVRMTLKNATLDKHAAPIMYGPYLNGDGLGDVGNYIQLNQGDQQPNYLVWDASMQAVENAINQTQEDVANLSGLGSLLSSKTFGESQGYDALMIKLAPALMRTRKKRTALQDHLKKLLSMLAYGNGMQIPEKDITITWKNGIPATEGVRADIAQKHLATGWSMFDVLTKDYGWTEEMAEKAIERKKTESPQLPIFGVTEEEPQETDGSEQGGDNA